MYSTSPLYALFRLLPNWAKLGYWALGAVGRGKIFFSEPPTRADRPKTFTRDWGTKKVLPNIQTKHGIVPENIVLSHKNFHI
jgi:hypothetical protein